MSEARVASRSKGRTVEVYADDRGISVALRGNGTRNTPDNVRRRVVATVHERANQLLGARGAAEIDQLTPHTLRRTFASLLAELGVSPRRAMYLLGHSDPKHHISDLHTPNLM